MIESKKKFKIGDLVYSVGWIQEEHLIIVSEPKWELSYYSYMVYSIKQMKFLWYIREENLYLM